jgi:transposase-like protein
MSSQKVFREVLAGPERRRQWSGDEKREIVSESLQPSAVATRDAADLLLERG